MGNMNMSMAAPPYMMSVKNIPSILNKIKTAGTPPKFNVEFLKSSLGFASSADRGMVAQLRYLKFITDDGTPTDRYNLYKGEGSKSVLAAGIREGYAEVFLADQRADTKTVEQLKDMFASLTGKGDTVVQKMASTFKALCSQADFTKEVTEGVATEDEFKSPIDDSDKNNDLNKILTPPNMSTTLNLRHDVHVHLPATSDVSVYKAIFRAINDELAD